MITAQVRVLMDSTEEAGSEPTAGADDRVGASIFGGGGRLRRFETSAFPTDGGFGAALELTAGPALSDTVG